MTYQPNSQSEIPNDDNDRRSSTSTWMPWLRAKPRVAALELNSEGSFDSIKECLDSSTLQDCLSRQRNTEALPRRTIYIVQGLGENITAVLQAHFKMNSALFEDHNRLVPFDNRATGEGGGISFLPSTSLSRDYITYKYHEVMKFSTVPTGFRNLCDVSGRHIAVTRAMGKFSDIAVVRRKCTFWSKKTKEDGWDCLIICDPPVRRVLTEYSGRNGYDVATLPYNAGYVDFMPQKVRTTDSSGPPRTSFLEDIVFYLKTCSSALDLTEHGSPRLFVEKIIASHYLKLSQFSQAVIEKVQFNLSRRQDLTSFAVASAEEQWSDVQSLERRIGEYKDDIEAIMLQSRIPFENPNLRLAEDWKDSAVDYQFLNKRFREIGQRANGLNDATTALASLTNNRHAVKAQNLALKATERSIREAKSAKALTMLGVIFIPLAYVSSLFSMSDPYRPGEELFWVYFAVALPLIAATVLGFYILEFGIISGRTQWSFRAALDTARGKLNWQSSQSSDLQTRTSI